jgi:hypothetical protein
LALSSGAVALLVSGLAMVRAMGPAGPVAGGAYGGDAAQVLHRAAQVALLRGEPVPAAGRFTFVESIDRYSMAVQQKDGTFQSRDRGTQVRQVWLSVDGTQVGLIRLRPASDPAAASTELRLDMGTPGYLVNLPTDAASMSRYLYAHSQGDNPRDEQAFRTAVDLLLDTYLTPAQQAAMFDAVARIPGITVQANVADLAGRHGVAVVMSGSAGSASAEEVIFDPDTGRYLGTGTSALMRQAVVDRPGQIPPA